MLCGLTSLCRNTSRRARTFSFDFNKFETWSADWVQRRVKRRGQLGDEEGVGRSSCSRPKASKLYSSSEALSKPRRSGETGERSPRGPRLDLLSP